MANPKRASMREGPLAALFRKTEGEDGGEPSREEEVTAERSQARRPPPPRPARSARRSARQPV